MTKVARRICVTGATGKAGLVTVRHLREHGYEVVATDNALSGDDVAAGVMKADLTDYGQATEVLRGTDAVVHLANIPAPGRSTPAVTFNANTSMNFNVFHAAAELGLQRVVWASSETVAGHIAQWSGIPFVALRFSNILNPADYERFPGYWADPQARKWNLWGYIDERDAAAACRLALTAAVTGSTSFIIAAADTVMAQPSADLMRQVFPGVPVSPTLEGCASLLSADRARQALGFVPRHSWRDHIEADA